MRKYIIKLLIKWAAQKHCSVPSTGYKIGDTIIIPNKFFPRHLRKLSEYFRIRTHSIATGAKEFCILKDCTKVSANCTFDRGASQAFFLVTLYHHPGFGNIKKRGSGIPPCAFGTNFMSIFF